MLRVACLMVLICGVIVIVLGAASPAQAHQDGCHSHHSCPSDTGSYVCGDTGNYSECPGLAAYALPAVSTTNFVSPEVGSIVNCSAGNWSVSVTSRSYQWLRNGLDAAGQTAPTYVLTAADVSVAVACRVTVTDGRGQTAVSTSNPVTLTPPPPLTALSPPKIDTGGSPVRRGSFLVCSAAKWSVSTASVAFQWLRDGVAITGATTNTYTVGAGDLGAVIACQQNAKGSRGQDGMALTVGVVALARPTLALRQQGARGLDLPCGATARRACRTLAGTVIQVGGTASAAIPLAGKIEVEFQRLVRGAWLTRKAARVPLDSAGVFASRYKVPSLAVGVWRARASVEASARTTGAVSPYRYLTVKQRPHR